MGGLCTEEEAMKFWKVMERVSAPADRT